MDRSTSCPFVRSRAGLHADEAPSSCVTSSASLLLDAVLRNTTGPFELTPCHAKVFFAKSMPSVETKFMGLSLSEGSMSQLNPDTSVSLWDGEVPYIR